MGQEGVFRIEAHEESSNDRAPSDDRRYLRMTTFLVLPSV